MNFIEITNTSSTSGTSQGCAWFFFRFGLSGSGIFSRPHQNHECNYGIAHLIQYYNLFFKTDWVEGSSVWFSLNQTLVIRNGNQECHLCKTGSRGVVHPKKFRYPLFDTFRTRAHLLPTFVSKRDIYSCTWYQQCHYHNRVLFITSTECTVLRRWTFFLEIRHFQGGSN